MAISPELILYSKWFAPMCGSHEYTSRIWKILIFLQTKIESSSREDLYVRSVRTIHYDMHMICI